MVRNPLLRSILIAGACSLSVGPRLLAADPPADPEKQPEATQTAQAPAIPAADPLADLAAKLGARDKVAAEAAARALAGKGAEAIATVQALSKRNPQPPLLSFVVAEMPTALVPEIGQALRADPDDRFRLVVARGLGSKGVAAMDEIAALAGSEDKTIRLTAFQALDAMSGDPKVPVPGKAVELLVAGTSDPEVSVREFATTALGRIGPRSKEVVPALKKALAGDADARVRGQAAVGLEKIARVGGADDGFAAVLGERLAKDDDPQVRAKCAAALGGLGAKGASETAALAAGLEDKFGSVRESCAHALFEVGEKSAAAIPKLVVVLSKDEWEKARWYAAGALGRMGTATEGSISALAAALDDSSRDVQAAAAQALSRLGAAAVPARESLVKALKHEQGVVREFAAVSLGNLGAEAKSAESALSEALKDSVPRVRSAAQFALQKIRGGGPARPSGAAGGTETAPKGAP